MKKQNDVILNISDKFDKLKVKINPIENQIYFNKVINEFKNIEGRAYIYAMVKKLISRGFKLEAYILILSTWNFAYFRYINTKLDLENIKKTLKNIERQVRNLKEFNIRTINLIEHAQDIINIFDKLSKNIFIKYTGASKILHLINPRLFVMWDDFISGHKKKDYYMKLEIIKFYKSGYPSFNKNGEGYLLFLMLMQYFFKNIKLRKRGITFAKAIDEFNYIGITSELKEYIKNLNKRKNNSLSK
jgi:hypothetical protein